MFLNFLYRAVATLTAMVLHEWAHGFASYKLGDPTPKEDGRLSLNPVRHVDPIGALCLLIAGFGWARPVQVNPVYYKDSKKGVCLTALAGPVTNFIIASISIIINKHLFGGGSDFFYTMTIINLGLGIFNLIPIPPLDGSKIIAGVLPNEIYCRYMEIERYGFYILIAIMAFGFLNGFLSTAIGSVFYFLYSVL